MKSKTSETQDVVSELSSDTKSAAKKECANPKCGQKLASNYRYKLCTNCRRGNSIVVRAEKRHLPVVQLAPLPPLPDRPVTRKDCLQGGINEERPCPWVSCKFHLAIDVKYDDIAGKLRPSDRLSINFPGIEDGDFSAMSETCALDVADRDGTILETLGDNLGDVTRERIRQIETSGLRRMKRAGDSLKIFYDEGEEG